MSPVTPPEVEQARRAVQAATNGTVVLPAEPLRLLSVEDLRRLPPVSWLIDGLLVARALVVLYGASGVGKSFLALDFALTVARGKPWRDDSETTGGWVLYIAAEGSAGLLKRVDAWAKDLGTAAPERIRFVADTVGLVDQGDVGRVIDALGQMPEPPVLIVIDTMARTLIGGDENSARDVGTFVANVDRIRAAAGGATALVLHHTGKKGDDERGSSALRGAADQMLALGEGSGGLLLQFTKLKDFEAPKDVRLQIITVADSAAIRLGRNDCELGRKELVILRYLSEAFGSDEVSWTRLSRSLVPGSMGDGTFGRSLRGLLERGFVAKRPEGRAAYYCVTPAGEEALQPTTANSCHGSGPIPAAKPPPFRGGSDDGNRDSTPAGTVDGT